MIKVQVIEGIVAEYNGKFWGKQHGDARYTCNDFGDLDKAEISDPKYCKKPTDKTYGYNPDFDKLSKAKLVMVKKTITIEVEIVK